MPRPRTGRFYYPPRGERGFAGPHGALCPVEQQPGGGRGSRAQAFQHRLHQGREPTGLATIYCIENDEGLDNLDKILEAGRPTA